MDDSAAEMTTTSGRKGGRQSKQSGRKNVEKVKPMSANEIKVAEIHKKKAAWKVPSGLHKNGRCQTCGADAWCVWFVYSIFINLSC